MGGGRTNGEGSCNCVVATIQEAPSPWTSSQLLSTPNANGPCPTTRAPALVVVQGLSEQHLVPTARRDRLPASADLPGTGWLTCTCTVPVSGVCPATPWQNVQAVVPRPDARPAGGPAALGRGGRDRAVHRGRTAGPAPERLRLRREGWFRVLARGEANPYAFQHLPVARPGRRTRRHALLDRELYLPEGWTDDPARLRVMDLAPDTPCATRPRAARRPKPVPACAGPAVAWVTGNSVYGHSADLRQWLEARDRSYVLTVAGNEHVWVGFRQVPVRDLWATLPEADWETRACGLGPRPCDWQCRVPRMSGLR